MSKEELINRRLGKTIAVKRKAAGFTQDVVAEHLEIGKEAFSRIERGLTAASVYKLYEMADLFRCGVEDFLIEGSTRPSEQAEYVVQMLSGVSPTDRNFVIQIVEKLARRLKSDVKRHRVHDGDEGSTD